MSETSVFRKQEYLGAFGKKMKSPLLPNALLTNIAGVITCAGLINSPAEIASIRPAPSFSMWR